MSPDTALREAMAEFGYDPGTIRWGKKTYFTLNGDKKYEKKGWFKVYSDPPQQGSFGDYRTGRFVEWRYNGNSGAAISAETKRLFERAKKDREERERLELLKAIEKYTKVYDKAAVADLDHPYLKRKGIDSAPGLKQVGDKLLVPMRSFEPGSPLTSLQSIFVTGKKLFAKGGRAHGARMTIGSGTLKRDGGSIYIVEGWATGWSIHEATGCPVVVAFSAGNLKTVTLAIAKKYPKNRIIVCADNDRWSKTPDGWNPGVTFAEQAAEAAKVDCIVPQFRDCCENPDCDKKCGQPHPTDFNDLHLSEGLNAVRRWLEPRAAPHAEEVPQSTPEELWPESEADLGPEPTPGESPQTLTDTGNAARLVAKHGERLHFIAPWRKWLVFAPRQGAWILDHADVRVRELAKDVGQALKLTAAQEPDPETAKKMFAWAFKTLNARGISGMVDLARGIDRIPLDHEDLDRNGWLLGVQNGVVDLHTGQLRAADPDDLMTRQCSVSWDQNATASRWKQAMVEWFPDPQVCNYVKRVAGSALVGGQQDHAFIIHYGGGRNGKGTFVRALQRVLGPYGVVIHLSLIVEQRWAQHDTVKAALFRARLAVASETQRRVKLDEASVKNLTGGDRIPARRMREDPWEFDPTHSLWLQTNYLPEIAGRDRGIWSRIRVVKWEATFEDQDQDQNLDDTLATEAPGILRWLVEGCLEWQEQGLKEPEAVVRETLAYRATEDIFSRFQADVGLVFRPDLEIQSGELQGLLNSWAQEEGVDPPRQEIGAWLKENGAKKTQRRVTEEDGTKKKPRFWEGVGVEDGDHESEQLDALE